MPHAIGESLLSGSTAVEMGAFGGANTVELLCLISLGYLISEAPTEMTNTLDPDPDGNVRLKPLTGWKLRDAAGIFVMASIQYADSAQEIEQGGVKTIAFVVTPQQCLELAAALTRSGNHILARAKVAEV